MSTEERAPDLESEQLPASASRAEADFVLDGREPALTDAEIERKGRLVDLENKETEVAKLAEELATERDNRSLRHGIAIAALAVMMIQVAASNAIFVWYGDTNGWEISSTAISVWMGTTVVEVVSVVLVIVNYLFPNHKKGE